MASADNSEVRVRFAPSPTGHWHLGGARTTLFNWLFARQNGGTLILRIEDTDKSRSDKKYELEIAEIMQWLGLDWDEGPTWENGKDGHKGQYGPYRQSERTAIYRGYLEKLIHEGKAYYCYCTKEELEAERQALAAQGLPPKYNGRCRNITTLPDRPAEAIRFIMPETVVEFTDMIRGTVKFDSSLFGDIIIAKNTDSPLYNFAVVVDDELMKITHVIRGEEHLGNTPKQILLQRALGFREPTFAHLPLILAADRTKLSKRYAETSMLSYREAGYLPEALINFLALLGWHPKEDREIISREELVKEFDIRRVQKAGAIFNEDKLDWLNREYMKRLSDEDISSQIQAEMRSAYPSATPEMILAIVRVLRERAKTMRDFVGESALFFEVEDYEPKILIWKNDAMAGTKEILAQIIRVLQGMEGEKMEREALSKTLEPLVSERGKGSVYWPMRVALSGKQASPDPLQIAEVIGKAESIRRIEIAARKLQA